MKLGMKLKAIYLGSLYDMNNLKQPIRECDFCWERPSDGFVVISPITENCICGECIAMVNGVSARNFRGRIPLEQIAKN